MKERLKDPFLWAGFSGLLYQVLSIKGIVVPQGLWDVGLDLVSYTVIGVGIVSGYTGNAKKE
ncbi:hypothetical protein [Aneurinibacillus aneurinilyticus]|jgi:hypothetical protein|uniref:Holin n=2 Tax=Aneurinibacillus aneurinilyticus TaxID=1391 RepID=A0A848CWL8_ANEAE|nr:hypothetical protein [Aneurinibacillus aneurinilyticus]ERI05163.1 hypothetical protein HMPREF0083_05736 [Aneurinibacillus aneurinilyticus ATCC 12856]MCI1694149.1 hypothetical protein [Aneurinibacillus aneurinilyticus]MED0672457.1 hypothetical protein [Aneurinibacillus aneurinilyticus]MED0708174.1 hypothetical protein [Aneurinibacillus aneurinilyticus]MED0721473.1 hypothetical protein [Aneurinibacillus aneurinilyticus]